MTEQEFETLWQFAECEPRADRLKAEYPEWRMRRRRTLGVCAAVAIAVGVALPMALLATSHPDYDRVYCNRGVDNAQQWVDLAADMLLES